MSASGTVGSRDKELYAAVFSPLPSCVGFTPRQVPSKWWSWQLPPSFYPLYTPQFFQKKRSLPFQTVLI